MASVPNNWKPPLNWLIDSGCSRHMTYAREAFTAYELLDKPVIISTANGTNIEAIGHGTVGLQVALGERVCPISLQEVLHIPRLAGSLLSVLQLQDRGFTVCTEKAPKTSLMLQR